MIRIFLIGYMGVGKTTLGKRLAARLDVGFIDLDRFIENRCHKTVPELFSEHGEGEFREIERRALREVAAIENVVVSTGGGTPCFFDNMELMNRAGTTVYIYASPEELATRLRTSRAVRPVVADKTKEELNDFIAAHLSQRALYYNQARILFKPDRLFARRQIPLMVEGIVKEIKKIAQ